MTLTVCWFTVYLFKRKLHNPLQLAVQLDNQLCNSAGRDRAFTATRIACVPIGIYKALPHLLNRDSVRLTAMKQFTLVKAHKELGEIFKGLGYQFPEARMVQLGSDLGMAAVISGFPQVSHGHAGGKYAGELDMHG